MIKILCNRKFGLVSGIFALTLAAAMTAQANLSKRVRDINTKVSNAGSAPTIGTTLLGSVELGGYVYFVANTAAGGEELWRTDGTQAGTEMVKDIYPGSSPFGSFPEQLTKSGNLLYFTASDRVTGGLIGPELFVSDGTAAGTRVVKDIRPGNFGSAPAELTDVNGTLYFVANDGVTGYELWKTDGTEAGTVLVKDIIAGPAPFEQFDAPMELTSLNGTVFFTACDTGHINCELWKSNGTAAGTLLVKDIYPGAQSSDI